LPTASKRARAILRRYGHPSVLLLVEIENLNALVREFGPEVAESAVLTAAGRIRQATGRGRSWPRAFRTAALRCWPKVCRWPKARPR
jgi:hypothetical protein